jgi:hypothetical protein
MSFKSYNIEGYKPYKKFTKNIKIEITDDADDSIDNDVEVYASCDIFELETFLLTFFVYNAFFKIFIWFVSFPPLGLIIFPLSIIMDGFSQSFIFSVLFTLYNGFMKGYYYRLDTFKKSGSLHYPEINIQVNWKQNRKFNFNAITYTADIYQRTPDWVYELYNDYNDVTYRTLIRWILMLYNNTKCYISMLYGIINNESS